MFASPTMDLILSRPSARGAVVSSSESEIEKLMAENLRLRRKLAHITAQYVWSEGGSYAKIDQEIRQYGFKLDKTSNPAHDPRIVPL